MCTLRHDGWLKNWWDLIVERLKIMQIKNNVLPGPLDFFFFISPHQITLKVTFFIAEDIVRIP